MEDLFKRFAVYKRDIEGRSKNSVEQYLTHIRMFCDDMNITEFDNFVNLKAQTIRDWLVKLATEDNNSPTSRNTKLSAIKEIYKFLEEEEGYEVDRFISKIHFAKAPQKESHYPTKDDMEQMFYVARNPRVKAAISILMSTGVRFSELLQITCTDIEKGEATIVGKGNKERTIYFTPICIKTCNRFIKGDRRKIIEEKGLDTDLLFISGRGTLITASGLGKSLKKCAKILGIEWYEEFSPHKFRHGFITEKLEDPSVAIQTVRDSVGHSSISTTNRYAHSNKEQIKKMMLGE